MTVDLGQRRAPTAKGRWVLPASHRIINHVLGGSAALLLFGMSAMTTADVIGRRFLGLPVPGSYELTSLMLAALIFIGLPLTTERDEHVVVDILDHLLPPSVLRVSSALMTLLSSLVLGVLSWQLWLRAGKLVADGAYTDQLRIPIAPVGYIAAFCCFLSALILAWKCVVMLKGPAYD
ncbi:TRAP transporter small permease [Telmatospirillum sp. J64-1]|uniref:TRAP transporter small permease n=1 Tax=Telmatospirillum sp. J64-1 TaxID=2502183 RepID=UPI00163DB06A|nr:TRAP transporter small permease [Telmatospirillum sp. J64-1]